jgi:diacylglycerol kinase (ATP)
LKIALAVNARASFGRGRQAGRAAAACRGTTSRRPDALVCRRDGYLDLFIVRPLSRLGFLAVFPRVFSGRHVGHPAVEIRRVRQVELEAVGVVAYADGERIGPLPLTVDAVPGAIRVLA